MKRMHLALAALATGAFALSAQAGETAWWTESFSHLDYADGFDSLTNAAASGTWSIGEGNDGTALYVGAYSNETVDASCGVIEDVLVLSTGGEDLEFDPVAPDPGDVTSEVLVDADIFFVGSDSAPTGFDSNSDVQFAIYLSAPDAENTESNKLCAYVFDDTANEGAWVELDDTAGIEEKTWHHVQVALDYSGTDKMLNIFVDGTSVGTFKVANNSNQPTTVNSVSFRGTGAIDNFTGKFVAAAPTHTFEAGVFVDGTAVANNDFILSDEGQAGTPIEFEVPTDYEGTALTKVVVTNLSTGTATTYTFTTGAVWTVSPDDGVVDVSTAGEGAILVTAATDGAATDGDPAVYTLIEVYYGEESTPPEPPADDPAVDIGGGLEQYAADHPGESVPDPVAIDNAGFKVSFVAPADGYYCLMEASTVDGTYTADPDTAQAVEKGDVITLVDDNLVPAKKFYKIGYSADPIVAE